MDLSAYELSLIAGAFAILGALIGGLVAYLLARQLAKYNTLITARAKLRATFAPALGQIYLAQNHGDHDRPSIADFVKNHLLTHASAIEEFRPFVTGDSGAYQQTWEKYREFANDSIKATAADWTDNLPQGSALEKRIQAILAFAKT